MIKVGRLVLVLGLLVVMTSGEVFAQSEEDRGNPVKFSITAEVEATDNRDSNSSEASNFDTYIKPKIDIISDTERTIFDFYYEPAYRYRTDPHPTQNDTEFQHQVGLKVKHQLGLSSKVRISERYVFTDDPSVTQGATTLRRDSSFSLNDLQAGISLDAGEQMMFDVGVSHMFKAYEEDIAARESDEDAVSAEMKLIRFLQPTLGIYGSLGFMQHGYDQAGGIERGYDAVNVGVGLDRVLSDYVKTGFKLGVTSVGYDDASLSDDNSPFLSALIQLQPSGQVKLLLSAAFALQNSDVYPYSSQETTDLNATIVWTGIERIKITAFGNYRLNKYDDANIPASALNGMSAAAFMSTLGFDADGNETNLILGSQLAYSVAERTTLTVAASIEDVDSDVSTAFTRSALKVGVTRTF